MRRRLERINAEVKKHDVRLFAVRSPAGVIEIHRKVDTRSASDLWSGSPSSHVLSQFILALTPDWKQGGESVDWGLEPLMTEIRGRDSWRGNDLFQQMIEVRERIEQDRKRQERNEIRARAADVRKDFARATNNISTTSL